jgi:O-methyltransferase involved in polyketide biosynthesis
MEAEEDSPLFRDPLAAALAGPRAVAAARRRQAPAPADSGRKIKVNAMAVRTRWFDDQVEAALGVPAPAPRGGGEAADEYYPEEHAAPPTPGGRAPPRPRQVVVLGAGMDARAWRLTLPQGLAWLEVDRPGVLEAKRAALAAAGAELGGEPASPMRAAPSANALLEAKLGALARTASSAGVPLRAERWAGVAADLGAPGWQAALRAEGHDARRPTLWVAEGLLMYLEPARATALLAELAALSAPGSALLAVSVTEEVVASIAAGGSKSELMRAWRFGCPPDPAAWLAGAGWRAERVTTRARIAAALGLDREVCGFLADANAAGDGRSLFIAATPSAAA